MTARRLSSAERRWIVAGLIVVALIAPWALDLLGTKAQGESPFTLSVEEPHGPADHREHLVSALNELAEPLPPLSPADTAPSDPAAPATLMAAVESVDVVPHVRRGDNLHRFYVPKEFFEDWYADATDDEIGLAKLKLEVRVQHLMTEAAETWFALGMQDEDQYFDHGEQSRDPEALLKAQPAETHGLYLALTTEDMGGGLMRQRRARLPWEEHQALYDLQDEAFWLLREWKRRTRGDR